LWWKFGILMEKSEPEVELLYGSCLVLENRNTYFLDVDFDI